MDALAQDAIQHARQRFRAQRSAFEFALRRMGHRLRLFV